MSIANDNFNTLSKNELIDKIKSGLEEKKSLEYLLNNLHGISWEFDLSKNTFTYVSSSAKDILGYELSTWTNFESWKNIIHEEDREEISNYCITQTEDGNDHSMEYRMLKKSGEIIWILDIVTLGRDESGKAVRLFGFLLDISEKKEQYLKVEKEHKFLQTIINGMSDPVMIINEDYNVPLMNDKVRKNLEGRTFMDQANPKCYEISHYRNTPCEGIDDPCPLKDVLASGKATKVMHNHKHADGSDQFVELAVAPIFDECNRCTGIIESARDVTEYIQLANKLQEKTKLLDYQAHHDYLTGLPNRALFMDRLDECIKDSRRNKKCIAIFFMDLDHFKAINDTYGHEMGDKVLIEVSKRFGEKTRDNDVLSRLGGDEFTLILKNVYKKKDIEVIAQKFIDIFNTPVIIDAQTLRLSTSIGISTYIGQNISADELLSNADTAMYKAKEKGKSDYTFFQENIFKYSAVSENFESI